jgi:hypothetical protein
MTLRFVCWKTVIFRKRIFMIFSNCQSKSSIINHITLSRRIYWNTNFQNLNHVHVGCVDNVAKYKSTVHRADFEHSSINCVLKDWNSSNYKEGMLFHIPLHGVSRYDGLEAQQTSKPQNWRALFDVELYLTVQKSFDFVSTWLNIFIVVARAIPIGRSLNYTKIQWAQSPWPCTN